MQKYDSPAAVKQALEQRLRTSSSSGVDFARRRQLLVFDPFLARVVRVMGDAAILKGGLALELRLDRARTTKDIDLRMTGSPEGILDRLREAGRLDLGDFMTFEVRPDPEHPEILDDGMKYQGLRYRTECKLAGKTYGQPFGVDVPFAEPIIGEPDVVVVEDVLSFTGIASPAVRLYPVESHIAEKLHAYTMPRDRENSRVKDLPDLALLAKIRNIDGARLRQAMEQTFSFRATHPLPPSVPDPPASWAEVYVRMAQEDQLEWTMLPALLVAVRAFLDPPLAGTVNAIWLPKDWVWRTPAS
jgi:hypothetical protein